MDRRRYLAALVTVPLTTLAGCSDGESTTEAGTNTATDTTTGTATESPTATATATDTATEQPTATDTATEQPTATGETTSSDAATATDTTTETASPTPTDTATPTETVPSSQTVEVAPGSFRFSPESFEIAVGGTVEWVWEAGGHNVVVDSQPAGSEWEGTPGDAGTTYGEGYTHEYTFEVPGTYEYYCAPHEGLEMVGSFEVVE